MEDRRPNAPETGGLTGIGVILARLMWALFGPFLLVLFAWRIVTLGSGWLTAWDAAFGLIVVLMIAGRWVEQRSGSATTITGEPATVEQCRRYDRILLGVAGSLWVVANVVGNHVMR